MKRNKPASKPRQRPTQAQLDALTSSLEEFRSKVIKERQIFNNLLTQIDDIAKAAHEKAKESSRKAERHALKAITLVDPQFTDREREITFQFVGNAEAYDLLAADIIGLVQGFHPYKK